MSEINFKAMIMYKHPVEQNDDWYCTQSDHTSEPSKDPDLLRGLKLLELKRRQSLAFGLDTDDLDKLIELETKRLALELKLDGLDDCDNLNDQNDYNDPVKMETLRLGLIEHSDR